MSTARTLVLLTLIGVSGTAGAPRVLADSAISPGSSWSRVGITADKTIQDAAIARGRAVFIARCQACHGDYPRDTKPALFRLDPMPGTRALELRYRGTVPAVLEQRTDLRPELITHVVRHGIGSMPMFRPTEVSDEDLKALVQYLTRQQRR
jgi:mono/diheme cytochrome c family protein